MSSKVFDLSALEEKLARYNDEVCLLASTSSYGILTFISIESENGEQALQANA